MTKNQKQLHWQIPVGILIVCLWFWLASSTVFAQALPAPTDVHNEPGKAYNTVDSIIWKWTGVTGAEGYFTYVETPAHNFVSAESTNSNSFTLRTNHPLALAADTSYTVRVASWSLATGVGEWSDPASAATSADVPTNLNAEITNSEIIWTWASGGQESGYYADLKEDPNTYHSGWLPWRFSDGDFNASFGFRSLADVSPVLADESAILIAAGDNLTYALDQSLNNFLQGTFEFWVNPQWSGSDGLEHDIASYYINNNNLVSLKKTAANDQWAMTVKANSTAISATLSSVPIVAGTWYYVTGVWDIDEGLGDGSYAKVYVDGTAVGSTSAAPGTPASASAQLFIGHLSGGNEFDGNVAGRVLKYPLSGSAISANYNAGSGAIASLDVTPETVWLGNFSADNTDQLAWHRGQEITGVTATSVSLSAPVSSRSWQNDQRVTIWDATGFSVPGYVSEVPDSTDTALMIDDGSGGSAQRLTEVGRILSFDGADSVSHGNFSLFEMGFGDLSLDFWFRPQMAANEMLMVKGAQTAAQAGYGCGLTVGGLIQSRLSNGVGLELVTGTTDVVDGLWHHVAIVWDRNGQTRIYIDGELDAFQDSIYNSYNIINATQALVIGKNGNDNNSFFHGEISEARVYKTLLTATDVQWLTGHPKVLRADIDNNLSNIITASTQSLAAINPNSNVVVEVASVSDFAVGQPVHISDGTYQENTTISAINNAVISTLTLANVVNTYAANAQIDHSGLILYSSFYRGSGYDSSVYRNDGIVTGAEFLTQARVTKNLIADNEMENGGIGGWQGTNVTIKKVTVASQFDRRALEINCTLNGGPCHAWSPDIPVKENDYCLSVWQKNGPASAAQVYLQNVTADPETLSSYLWRAPYNISGAWQAIGGCYRPPAGVSAIRAVLTTDIANNNAAYYDELTFLPSILTNSSLENPNVSAIPYYWAKQGAPTLSAETGHSGANAVGITGSADTNNALYQMVNYQLGKRYRFNLWVKRASGAGKPIINLGGLDDSWHNGGLRTYDESLADGEWHAWTFTTWLKSTPTNRSLYLAADNADTTILYDDIAIIELDVIANENESSSSFNTSLTTGHYNDERGALLVDAGDIFTYPTADNVSGAFGTVAMWVSPRLLNTDRKLFSIYIADDKNLTLGLNSDNKAYVNLNGQPKIVGPTVLNALDTWYHVAFTWEESNKLNLYVNKVAEGSYLGYGAVVPGATLEIGSENQTRQANAAFDDIYVFRNPLSIPEIAVLGGATPVLNWRNWAVQNLSCGVRYTGRVKAANRDGDETEWKESVEQTAPCPTYCGDADDCRAGDICLFGICLPPNRCVPRSELWQ